MTTDDGMTAYEDIVNLRRWLREKEDEIERLSLALANAKISFDAIDATLAERDAEIERLRADRDSWAQQADDRVNDLQEFIAEIERLRGLLRIDEDETSA